MGRNNIVFILVCEKPINFRHYLIRVILCDRDMLPVCMCTMYVPLDIPEALNITEYLPAALFSSIKTATS